MTIRANVVVALLALLALTYLVYWQGLDAGFLFDDFVNLDALGATGPIDDWATFFRYITSGTADPTGRPLALLSFLIDARNWPADPRPFLHTNLLLHLFNGALVFMLLRSLGRRLDGDGVASDVIALLAAGMWLLHPLLVSTTLYAVQREAMLPGTFILLGLLAYSHGRALRNAGAGNSGLAWMTAGILVGTALATLCKANGLLLPVLALVLEKTVLGRSGQAIKSRADRIAEWSLLILPGIALSMYLASFAMDISSVLPYRGWSVGQRLLTEARVVCDYLGLLVVPRSVSSGLYNDGYVISTGLLHPWTTLPAMMLVVGLPIAAWVARARFPALAAAVLFYFAAHLLESTLVPLELYFEHRNYLPAMLLFWPLARAIVHWPRPVPVRGLIAAAILGLLAFTTFQRATIWGDPRRQSALWAAQNPDSSRAQVTAAMIDTSNGSPDRALARLGPIWQARRDDLQIAFNYVNASCALGALSNADARAVEDALRGARSDIQLVNRWLGNVIEAAANSDCRGVTLDVVERWLAAAANNPAFHGLDMRGQEIEPLRAHLAMHRGRPAQALVHFDRALSAFATPDVAARQASTMAMHGYYREALAHLDHYESLRHRLHMPSRGMPWLHARVLAWQDYWPREMEILRGKLLEEIRTGEAAPAGPATATREPANG